MPLISAPWHLRSTLFPPQPAPKWVRAGAKCLIRKNQERLYLPSREVCDSRAVVGGFFLSLASKHSFLTSVSLLLVPAHTQQERDDCCVCVLKSLSSWYTDWHEYISKKEKRDAAREQSRHERDSLSHPDSLMKTAFLCRHCVQTRSSLWFPQSFSLWGKLSAYLSPCQSSPSTIILIPEQTTASSTTEAATTAKISTCRSLLHDDQPIRSPSCLPRFASVLLLDARSVTSQRPKNFYPFPWHWHASSFWYSLSSSFASSWIQPSSWASSLIADAWLPFAFLQVTCPFACF